MDPLALLAIPFVAAMAAHNAAMVQHYARPAEYAQPYGYAVPVVPGPVAGAGIGAGIGALASASRPEAVLAGALVGGIVGAAATAPPVYGTPAYVQPVDAPRFDAPPIRSRGERSSAASTEAFISHWQNFMEGSGRR